MKPVVTTTEAASQDLKPLGTLPENIQSNIIHKIFSKFEFRFGSEWTNKFNLVDYTKLIDSWAEDLSDLKIGQLKIGLEKTRDLKKPPSLGDFRELCKTPALDHESFKTIESDKPQVRSQESIKKVNEMLSKYKNQILKSMEDLDNE